MAQVDLDPAPGVCPACINERLATIMGRALVLMFVMGEQQFLDWLRDELRQAGLVEPFISYFVNGNVEMIDAVRTEALRRIEGT